MVYQVGTWPIELQTFSCSINSGTTLHRQDKQCTFWIRHIMGSTSAMRPALQNVTLSQRTSSCNLCRNCYKYEVPRWSTSASESPSACPMQIASRERIQRKQIVGIETKTKLVEVLPFLFRCRIFNTTRPDMGIHRKTYPGAAARHGAR